MRTDRRVLEALTCRVDVRAEDPLMRDHVVHGVSIMPGVTCFDLVWRIALAQGCELDGLELRKALFMSPVAASDELDSEIEFELTPTGDHARLQARCRTRRRDGEHGAWRDVLQAELHYGVRIPDRSIDIEALRSAATRVVDMDDVYAVARSTGIVHGDFMRGRGRVHIGREELLAELSLGEAALAYRDYFCLHPVHLDASTNVAYLFGVDPAADAAQAPAGAHAYVPLYIESFQARGRTGESLWVRVAPRRATGDDLNVCDVEYYDGDARLVMRLNGLTSKRVRSAEAIAELLTSGISAPAPAAVPVTQVSAAITPAAPGEWLATQVRAVLAEFVAGGAEAIDAERGFYELGLDSKDLLQIVRRLEARFAIELYPTVLFEHGHLDALIAYLAREHGAALDQARRNAVACPPSPRSSAALVGAAERDLTGPAGLVWFESTWVAAAAPHQAPSGPVVVLVLEHEPRRAHAFGARLAEASASLRVIAASCGEAYREAALDRFELRRSASEDYERLLERLANGPGLPGLVVYRAADRRADDPAARVARLESALADILHLTRAWLARPGQVALRLVACIEDEAERGFEPLAGLGGMFRSLRLEHPGLRCTLLRGGADDASRALAEWSTDADVEVRYRAGRREVRRFREIECSRPARGASVGLGEPRTKGAYLISGGLGGVGLVFARSLARRAQARLVLCGRSALDARRQAQVGELESLGAEVLYVQADVSDAEAVRRVVDTARRRFGALTGVIHAAGVLRDSLAMTKTLSGAHEVLAPRVAGGLNLDAATAAEPLDFFALFSSTAGAWGNVGQADYACANAFLDAFAAERARLARAGQRAGRSLSIGWPAWRNGGMRLDPAREADLRSRGLELLDDNAGVDAFHAALAHGVEHALVLAGDAPRVRRTLAEEAPAFQGIDVHDAAVRVLPATPVAEVAARSAPFVADDLVAIVGVSGRYPMAADLEQFWNNLRHGRDCISEIPSSRWNHEEFFSPQRGRAGKTYAKWGGFLDGVDEFDPLFFHISPREALVMDPQERLFLQTAWHTLEDAGYAPGRLKGRAIGVYVGVMYSQYQLFGVRPRYDADTLMPSGFLSSIANRVSYCFDFRGPSLALDTACSSSLTAIHQACDAILGGQCEAALAGGVNLTIHPTKYLLLSQSSFLSSDGRCRAFGEGGDGYVPGEGVGAVLLKRLSQAVRERDQIYAVVRGRALNHGGRTGGYSVPSPEAQAQVLVDAFERAAIDPTSVGYIEAHGTGTQLGDPIELAGLEKAFSRLAALGLRCPIGSVKSNIGHLESAAGIAAVTKVLLQMRRRRLVPSLHTETLNSNVDWSRSSFVVQRQYAEWRRPRGAERELPLRAGISSFGAGGANAHLVLEEYPLTEVARVADGARLFVFSARSDERLRALVARMVEFLKGHDAPSSAAAHDGARPALSELHAVVRDVLGEVLGAALSRAPLPDETLSELGLDCASLAGFARALEERLGVELPALFVDGESTPAALVQRLGDRLRQRGDVVPRGDADDDREGLDPAGVAFTLQVGRESLEERLAVVASGLGELVEQLDAFLGGGTLTRMRRGRARAASSRGSLPDAGVLDAWTHARDLERLAEAWVCGASIEWSALYDEPLPRRLSLPGYPFERERYWVPVAAQGESAASPHSWLGVVDAARSVEQGVAFRRVVTPDDAAVRDHVIGGVPILPGVVALEMARAAWVAAGPAQADRSGALPMALEHVRWVKPLTVSQAVTAWVSIERQAALWHFKLVTEGSDGPQVHALGSLRLADRGAPVARVALADVRRRCRESLDGVELYRRFDAAGLVYGESMRALQGVEFCADEALARVALSDAQQAELPRMPLHPALLDAALQVTGVLLGQVSSQVHLPAAVERVELLGPPAASGYAHVRRTESARFDVALLDEHGTPRVCLHNVSLRAARASADADPATEPGELLYVPHWEARPEPDASAPVLAADDAVLIVHHASCLELARALAAEHAPSRTHLVPVDAVARGDGDVLAPVLSAHAPRRVYFLAGFAASDQRLDDPVALETSQQEGVLSLFRVVQALIARGAAGRELGLSVITRDVCALPDAPAHNPFAGSVHGLALSLAQEQPGWDVSVLDFGATEEGSLDWRALAAAFARERGRPGANLFAWRDGVRYRRRLLPVAGLPEASALRDEGVYLLIGGGGGIGLELADYLVRRHRARVALVGRSAPGPSLEQRLRAIDPDGRHVTYYSADAGDALALGAVVRATRERHGALHGVVHAAMVLQDQRLEHMHEATLRGALDAKARVCVALAATLAAQPPELVLFFSSMASLHGGRGQGNYAAGCTFKDAFAPALEARLGCPVKVINWGYWGSVGAVAQESYRRRLAQQGIESIEPAEAWPALERIAAWRAAQAIVMKARHEALAAAGADFDARCTWLPRRAERRAGQVLSAAAAEAPPAPAALFSDVGERALDECAVEWVFQAFVAQGVFDAGGDRWGADVVMQRLGAQPRHRRLVRELLRILAEHGRIQRDGDGGWSALPWRARAIDDPRAEMRRIGEGAPAARAFTRLLEPCLDRLVPILRGDVAATEVLFPGSSTDLVEGIYQSNPVADYFNEVAAWAVGRYVAGAHEPRGARVRVLEIGAGTGGTSAVVLSALRRLGPDVDYCYSDISKAFLAHGRQRLGGEYPGVEFRLLDITRDPRTQGFTEGSFDLALATNVLHATPDVRAALTHVKTVLRAGGWLVVNEGTRNIVTATLTFGLLDGWWAHEDTHLRLPGCPLLSRMLWRRVLAETGYEHFTALPAGRAPELRQHVLVAQSDGRIPLARATAAASVAQVLAPAEAGPPRASGATRDAFEAFIKDAFRQVLDLPAERMRGDETFENYGIDSLTVPQITARLAARLGSLSSTLLFEYPTLDALTEHLLQTRADALAEPSAPRPAGIDEAAPTSVPAREPARQAVLAPEPATRATRVAIIGLSGRYPMAPTLHEFWRNLREGRDCVREVPTERWDWREHREIRGRAVSRWGAFLDDIELFDPLFFNMSPREAAITDPQERLFLETAWHTLEAAGYPKSRLRGRRVGVYVGVMYGHYQLFETEDGVAGNVGFASVANRVSYCFDLRGPSLAVDTMCSSSLSALHLALVALRGGEIDYALVGGVNLSLHPRKYLQLGLGQFTSAGGRCRSFGADGDGMVPGEGVGAVLLKRLDDAERDGDYIHALIAGSALNHGGKTSGFSVPSPVAQGEAIREALERSGIDPASVSYVEAHGTGTELGDPIEINGLMRGFGPRAAGAAPCLIGSVKSNIGHLEAAAGIAGLTKVVLQLAHQEIAPTLHVEPPNPRIDWQQAGLALPGALAAWPAPEHAPGPRRAGVSSFGAGGANAHVVVEEYVRPQLQGDEASRSFLFVFSAQSEAALRGQVVDFLAFVEAEADLRLAQVAYTLQVGREAFDERLAFGAASRAELAATLRRLAGTLAAGEAHRGRVGEPSGAQALIRGEAGRAYLDALIQARDWALLGRLWTEGVAVDWARLYDGRPPGVVPLPGYHFVRERCWIETAASPARARRRPAAHTWLGENVSTLDVHAHRTRLEGDEWFLEDHRVAGRKVLPGAAALAMVHAAGAQATGGVVTRFTDVVWSRPIVVDATPVELRLELRSGSGAPEFEVLRVLDGGGRERCASGRLERTPGAEAQGALSVDLGALCARCQTRLEGAEVYRRFEALGLAYGGRLRALSEVFQGEGEVLARVDVHATAGELFDAALLDAAFQTVAVWQAVYGGGGSTLALPFAAAEVELLGAPGTSAYVHTRGAASQVSGGASPACDLDVMDAAGGVVARIRHLALRAVPAQSAAPDTGAPGATEESAQTVLFVPAWEPSADGPVTAEPRSVLVFSATAGLTTELRRVLGRRGADVVGVHPGERFARRDRDTFNIRADAAEDYERLLGILADEQRVPEGVVYHEFAPLTPGQADEAALWLERGVLSLARLSQAWMARRLQQPARLLYVYRESDDYASCHFSALRGFARSLAAENPSFRYTCVELDAATPHASVALAPRLCRELARPHVFEVRLEAEQRLTRAFHELPPPGGHDGVLPVREGGVYLITGGMGGLGWVLAERLRHAGAVLVLSGRSGRDERVEARLDALRSRGGRAEYVPADVAARDDVARLTRRITTQFGPLRGVVHAAGVIEDAFLLKKDLGSFRRVLAPKIDGALGLDEATREQPLDFFVVLSSLSGELGNAGQTDYAYANAFLDDFAAARERLRRSGRRQGTSLALALPLWAAGGMTLPERSVEALRRGAGIVPLTTPRAMAVLAHELLGAGGARLVTAGDATRIRAWLRSPEVLHGAVAPTSAPVALSGDELVTRTSAWLAAHVAAVLGLTADRLRPETPFEAYGLDSVMILDVTAALEKDLGRLSKTLFFEHRTLRELSLHFAQQHADRLRALVGETAPAPSRAQAAGEATRLRVAVPARASVGDPSGAARAPAACNDQQPIAIVGLAGRYPLANDLDEFWKNLQAGRDCVTEVPSERFDWRAWAGHTYDGAQVEICRFGGFLRDVGAFDPVFFNMTPREARVVDPQERLFLETAWHAVEDAGYAPSALTRRSVGVFVGVMYGHYELFEGADGTYGSSSFASIANRVSYVFDWQGPSIGLDTMCSSSLTAIHLACESLRRGECELALAGGVNLSLHPRKFLTLGAAHFASRSGRCRSFGEGGDGYVPGEGVGAVLLKPYARALADGDVIHATILASALNHGGRTNAYTVPNPVAQGGVIRDALERGRVRPETLSYVEVHGTGTALGDPIEINGLERAFAGAPVGFKCLIGSVKSNIGHAESAAGIAALTKVVLQMRHRRLVRSLHAEELNRNIDWESSPFEVQRTLAEWHAPRVPGPRGEELAPRRAGVSSFGAGGANAHLILEEPPERPAPSASAGERLVVLSARTEIALRQLAGTLARRLAAAAADVDTARPTLDEVAYTLQVGRKPLEKRLALTASDIDELRERLECFARREEGPRAACSNVSEGEAVASGDGVGLAAALRIRDWAGIAQAWVSGADVDWSALYENPHPRRVSLPGYPFERRPCLIAADLGPAARGARRADAVGPHPLLDERVSPLAAQTFRKVLRSSDFYMADHRLGEQCVLPGSAHLEMARAAGAAAAQRAVTAIRDVTWRRLVSLEGAAACEIFIDVRPQDDGAAFEIHRATSEGREVLSRGRLAFETQAPLEAGPASRLDLHALRARLERLLDREANDRVWAQMGFRFGPAFQVIEEVYGGEREALVKLLLPAALHAEAARFTLHPALMDGALRAVLGVSAPQGGEDARLRVPFSLGAIQIRRPLEPECYVRVVSSPTTDSAASLRKFDLTIHDCEGVELARVREFAARVLRDEPAAADAQPERVLAPTAGTVARASAGAAFVPSPAGLRRAAEAHLRALFARVTRLSPAEIDPRLPFEEYGIDSVMVLELNDLLQADFGQLPATLLFEHKSLAELCDHFVSAHASRLRELFPQAGGGPLAPVTPALAPVPTHVEVAGVPAPTDAVAIIGLSGRFPLARDVGEFWENLKRGRDCIAPMPAERWRPRPADADGPEGKWGGFLDGYDEFDARFFHVSPREAEILDPQERLFLQTAWHTFEDAGYTRRALKGRSVGVFVGLMYGHYQLLENAQGARGGASYASVANRVSYFMDLAGPSVTLDTACSSSLSAIHLALHSLRGGDCELALAGGVNVFSHPYKYRSLGAMGFLSSEGLCRSFGEGGDGFVPGEGVGALLLKPLARAVADRDPIRAVILASAMNHGGKTNGFTVPNPVAQGELIARALARAGVDPRSISYIEAHGTGTALGDPIEISGLLRGFQDAPVSCAIGSVKSNVGHLESAAGVAAVIKVVLQMEHRALVPSLHADALNARISWATCPFRVQRELEEWQRPEVAGELAPRRAGVSSFGAGGANAHLVLEECEDRRGRAVAGNERELVVLSARGEERLARQAAQLAEFLERAGDELERRGVSLSDVAYTLQIGREEMEARLALCVSSLAELRAKLDGYLREPGAQAGIYIGDTSRPNPLSELISGEAGRASLLEHVLRERDLEALACLWVNGVTVDWNALHAEAPPRRVSLPGYPFKAQRFWIENDPATTELAAAMAGPPSRVAATVGAPRVGFFDARVRVTPAADVPQAWDYDASVSAREFFLRDHVFRGQSLLPGMTYVELAASAARRVTGRTEWSFAGVVLLRRLVVDAERALRGRLTRAGEGFEYSIGSDDGGAFVVCSQGRLRPTAAVGAAPPARVDLEALRRRCGRRAEGQAIYRVFAELGFQYGPTFRSIETMDFGPGEALSELALTDEVRALVGDFVVHPALMDGALQTVAGVHLHEERQDARVHLPYAVGGIEVLRSLAEKVFAYARVGRSGDEVDVDLIDAQGEVLVRLTSVVLKAADSTRPAATRGVRPAALAMENAVATEQTLLYQPAWVEAPLEREAAEAEGAVVAFMDSARDEAALRTGLTSAGAATVLSVVPGVGYRRTAENAYEIDPESEDDYRAVLSDVRGRGLAVTGLLHVGGLRDDAPAASGEALPAGLRSIVALFKAQTTLGQERRLRCIHAYRADAGGAAPSHECVAGFASAIVPVNYKFELVSARFDAAAAEPARLGELLLGELQARGSWTGMEVAHTRQARMVRRLQRRPVPAPAESRFVSGGVYLISGGAGGLGFVVARYLASRFKARLALCGRSAVSAAIECQLTQLREAGGQAIYVCADVSRRDEVEGLVTRVRRELGPLQGVIHSAGSVGVPVMQADRSSFEATLLPKVLGTLNLDHATRDEPLDLFVLFSSVSALMGDFGVGSYSAGNRFMDAYALRREELRVAGQRHGLSLSIGWPLWQEGGLRLPVDEAAAYSAKTGMPPLASEDGLALLELSLSAGAPYVVAARGRAAKADRVLRVVEAAPQAGSCPGAPTVAPPPTAPAAGEELERVVVHSAALVLKCPVAEISAHDELEELGFDSIGLAALAAELSKRLGLTLGPLDFVDVRTLAALVDKLRRHPAAAPPRAPVASVEPPARSIATEGNAPDADVAPRVTAIVAAVLKIAVDEIAPHDALEELGFDSISFAALGSELSREFELDLTPGYFADVPDMRALHAKLGRMWAAARRDRAATGSAAALGDGRDEALQARYDYCLRGVRDPRLRTLTSRAGTRLELLSAGAGQPVLLLPMLGCMTAWMHQLRELSRTHHVVSLQYPGFGRSEHSLEASQFEAIADMAAEALVEAGARAAAHVVGWSMGGFIAQLLSERHPAAVRSLTLVCSAAEVGMIPDQKHGLEIFKRDFLANLPDTLRGRPEGSLDFFWGGDDFDVVMRYLLLSYVFDFSARLARVEPPLQFIAGRHDRIFPIEKVHEARRAAPRSALAVIENAGHYAALQQAARVNERLREFLELSEANPLPARGSDFERRTPRATEETRAEDVTTNG